jgi:hypothetical protein
LPSEQRALANGKRRNGQAMTDAMLDQLVRHVGAGKLLSAIDRCTAPTAIAAE